LPKRNERKVKIMDEKVKKLIAVGASVGANCHPCLEYHVEKALEFGIEKIEIMAAVNIGKKVRGGATASMDKLAISLLNEETSRQSCGERESSCCC
jgi:AhpD family alkylhydroperoxidase